MTNYTVEFLKSKLQSTNKTIVNTERYIESTQSELIQLMEDLNEYKKQAVSIDESIKIIEKQ